MVEHKFLVVAIAGAFGAVSRYGLCLWIDQMWQKPFPLSTFLVNIVGCFLFGLAVALLGEKYEDVEVLQPFILAGFLGSFTTFSSYIFQSFQLVGKSDFGIMLAYIFLSILVGFALAWAGFALGKEFTAA